MTTYASRESVVKATLRGILETVPGLRLTSWERGGGGGASSGLAAKVQSGGQKWRLVVEVKGSGEPRLVRSAVQWLTSTIAGRSNAYGIVAAPYISRDSGGICREAGVGYLDLAGNCRLAFGQVFIERQGAAPMASDRRALRDVFAARSSRVLRVLFEEPKKTWQVQELAQRAKVSLGLAFKVKQRLLDMEYATLEGRAVRLARAEDLLRVWAGKYDYRKNRALDCYGSGEPPELERTLAAYCARERIPYALASFSGAARVVPFTRYSRSFALVSGDLEELARDLDWKPVPSGANFTLLAPFDEGVLYGARNIDGELVASDVQLFLDLSSTKGRGEEAAQLLLEQRLRSSW